MFVHMRSVDKLNQIILLAVFASNSSASRKEHFFKLYHIFTIYRFLSLHQVKNDLLTFGQRHLCGINGTNSTIKAIPYGVAQGSTLGLLLFLLCIFSVIFCYTYLPYAVISTPRFFADDTCLISDYIYPEILQEKMSLDLASVHKWCIANKSSLNPAKSSFFIIPPELKICCNLL